VLIGSLSRWQASQKFSRIKAESEYGTAEFLTKPVDFDQLKIQRNQPGSSGGARRRLLQPPRHLRAVHQRGQGRDQVDPPVVPILRRECGPPPVACAGVQPWQFHADAGHAEDGGAMVAT
jgi:hypothetical protein